MAVSLETRRHDVRLESFLRRQLSPEVYERVSTSEGCVLLSPEEKRVHRYAILGHKQLFTTEFPPKNLKVLLNLEAITAISMLDDLPDFLSGVEQQNTVHIQIRYKRDTTPTTRDKWRSLGKLRKPQKERREVESLPGRAISPTGSVLSKGGTESPRLSPTPRRSPRLNLQDKFTYAVTPASPDLRRRSPGLAFATWSNLEISHHTPVQERGSNCGSPTPPSAFSYHDQEEDESPLNPRSRLLPEISLPGKKSTRLKTPLERSQLKSVSMKHLGVASLTKNLSYTDRTVSQPELYKGTGGGSHWKGVDPYISSSSETLSSLPPSSSIQSIPPSRSLNNLTALGRAVSQEGQEGGGGGGGGGGMEVMIDLYILKEVTDFYQQLRVCWENARINQVLQQSSPSSSPQVTSPPKFDKFSQQFCTLKEELLTAQCLESRAELAQELTTACQKYFIIKKMFWEDSELLDFGSRQLHLQLSHSKSLKSTQLENCIEYCIILLDLLYQMLREAHSLRKRLVQLTCNNGSPLLTLASTIAHGFPLQREVDHAQGVEFSGKACGVMFELVGVVEQARWPLAKRTKVSISWLVDSLFSNDVMRGFFSGMLKYVSENFSTDLCDEVEPHTLVTLYQLSTILHMFLKTAPSLTQFFRKHFTEEFKYYINIAKGRQALPVHQPLTINTLELLKACKSKILSSK